MNQPPRGPRFQRPQFQQLQNQAQAQYQRATSTPELWAAAACVVGGAVVVLLSLIGGAGDVAFLLDASYGWFSFVMYLLVVGAGLAIWKEVPFAVYGAAGLVGLEFAVSVVWRYGDTGTFPGFFIVVKGLVFLAIIQALRSDDDDTPQQPGPPQGYGPGPGPRGPMPRQGYGPGPGPRR